MYSYHLYFIRMISFRLSSKQEDFSYLVYLTGNLENCIQRVNYHVNLRSPRSSFGGFADCRCRSWKVAASEE